MLNVRGKGLQINGIPAQGRTDVHGGDSLRIGGTILTLGDRGNQPLWSGKKFDRILVRMGDRLVAAKGNTLHMLDATTGEEVHEGVRIPGARLMLVNTFDGMLYVVAGDAWVYGLSPR